MISSWGFQSLLCGIPAVFVPLCEKSATEPMPLDQETWCEEVLRRLTPALAPALV